VTLISSDKQVPRWDSVKERDYSMSELESHFMNELAEPWANSFVESKWWEDLPKIDSNLREKLETYTK
jgi:hypothetical protein